jgi:hypothetical protein
MNRSDPQTILSPPLRVLAVPLLLTTFGALLLELALTRLFSVVLFYHYAFLVISLALLGLAIGSMLSGLRPPRQRFERTASLLALLSLIAAVSLLPLLLLILHTNVWLIATWATFRRVALLFTMGVVPFAFVGYVIASVLRTTREHLAMLYAADLLGAGLACVAFVPLVNWLGGPNCVLLAGVVWCGAALWWARNANGSGRAAGFLLVALLALLWVNRSGSLLDVRYTRGEAVRDQLFSKWNAFSRVSVHRQGGGYWLKIDGGAGSWLSTIDVRAEPPALGRSGPELAFWLRPGGSSLVIGPGGGADVAHALQARSRAVTAVEINPIIATDIMRGRFREDVHRLYELPQVRLFVEDGRTFIGRTHERFDVIQLSQVDTWASSASGSYALTENYLYTVEALAEYLAHLEPGGVLSISRWEFPQPRETLRLLAVTIEALRRRGITDPRAHIMVAMEPLGSGSDVRMGTVLASHQPFSAEQVDGLKNHLAGSKMTFAYAPGMDANGPFAQLVLGPDRAKFYDDYPYNVTPVTDNRPFFFFTARWSLAALPGGPQDADAVNTGAQFLLLGLLVLAAAAVVLFLFLPLLLGRRHGTPARSLLPFLFYATAVGIGYILVEVVFIQHFVVTLGNPTYALTVVLFGMLVASSAGAALSQSIDLERAASRVRWAAAIIALALVALVVLLPLLLTAIQAWPLAGKIAVMYVIVLPLGTLMGMPFPTALRLAGALPHGVEWSWSVNAAATVLGPILAVFLAVVAGFHVVLLTAATAYALASALLPVLGKRSAAEGATQP